MYNQGSFITGFFPKDVLADLDANVGVMGFPPATAGGENPVMGGGDMAMLLSDNDNAKTVIKYLSETDIGNDAAPTSSFISPHKDFDVSALPERDRPETSPRCLRRSDVPVRRSDQMPGEVGAGTFWKDMTAWISGQEDLTRR